MDAPKTVVLIILLLCSASIQADRVGYSGVSDLRGESATIVVEHHHDWSEATRDARWKMISTNRDPFGADNTYSYLRVFDKASGRQLFETPVPALTFLWISPDSRFIVGLSKIKLWNPIHLVVFDSSGQRLLASDITQVWPEAPQTVSNWISWYKEPTPTIRLEQTDDSVTLAVEDSTGSMREFQFSAAAMRP